MSSSAPILQAALAAVFLALLMYYDTRTADPDPYRDEPPDSPFRPENGYQPPDDR